MVLNQTEEWLAVLLNSKTDSNRQKRQNSPSPHACLTMWQPQGSTLRQSWMVAKTHHPPRATQATAQQLTQRKHKPQPCWGQMQSIGPNKIMDGKSDASKDIPKLQKQTSPQSKLNFESPMSSSIKPCLRSLLFNTCEPIKQLLTCQNAFQAL